MWASVPTRNIKIKIFMWGDMMEFVFETTYNQKALTTMAKGVRKTARKKRTKRSHIFGWIVIALAVFLALADIKDGIEFTANRVITLLAALIILIVLLFEDKINGYVARKRMLPGTEKSKVTFIEEGFYSETEVGKSEWNYDRILILAETKDYFIFIFSSSHAQVYDKNNLFGGTVDEFRKFICERTGKSMTSIK